MLFQRKRQQNTVSHFLVVRVHHSEHVYISASAQNCTINLTGLFCASLRLMMC